ncbi:MAG: hypothetical protein M0Z38_04545 [Deltaproteobacteria bacterium]|nr:hypothetical protein [Deltaproteobacteria bacterium]
MKVFFLYVVLPLLLILLLVFASGYLRPLNPGEVGGFRKSGMSGTCERAGA